MQVQKKIFLDNLVRELLPRISDSEPRVRRQGLIGLGNLSDVWSDELIPTAPAILSSLTSAVEDKIEIVCISAIKSLIKILKVIDINTVTPSLINICFRTEYLVLLHYLVECLIYYFKLKDMMKLECIYIGIINV